jgi:hypothetical protein
MNMPGVNDRNRGIGGKVNCKVACAIAVPSIAETNTRKLPSSVGIPVMKPVGGSRLSPGREEEDYPP